MNWTLLALILSGGLVLAGLSYPTFAQSQPGWKTGAWASSNGATLWYAAGAVAYLGGMYHFFGFWGLPLAIPAALTIGFGMTLAAKGNTQLIALPAPILANLWFMLG